MYLQYLDKRLEEKNFLNKTNYNIAFAFSLLVTEILKQMMIETWTMSILTFMNGYNYNFNRTCNSRNSSRLKLNVTLPGKFTI